MAWRTRVALQSPLASASPQVSVSEIALCHGQPGSSASDQPLGTDNRAAGAPTGWHFQGVLQWLIQRPFLRYLPFPEPMVATVKEWKDQLQDNVTRGVWARRWLQKAASRMSAVTLKEAQTLRSRLGLELCFMEDPALLFGIRMLRRRPRAKAQASLVEETHKAIAELDGRRDDYAREMIGPRGRLPKLKCDLVKLALLPRVPVSGDDTIEDLKRKVRPMVEELKAKPASQPSVKSKAAPKPSSSPHPSRVLPTQEATYGPIPPAELLTQVPYGMDKAAELGEEQDWDMLPTLHASDD